VRAHGQGQHQWADHDEIDQILSGGGISERRRLVAVDGSGSEQPYRTARDGE
jgi:hypothetical protein